MDFIEKLNITELVDKATHWVTTYLLDWQILIQLSISFCVYLLSIKLSDKPKQALDNYLRQKFSSETLDKYNEEAIISAVKPLMNLFLQWFTLLIAITAGFPSAVLSIIAKLLTAWVIIRSTSSLIKVPFLSFMISIVAWSIAALSITDTLDQTVAILDGIAFSIGSFRLSLLVVIQGLISFFIAIWIASFISRILDHRIRNLQHITPSVRVLISKISKTAIFVFAIMIVINSLGIDLTALAVFGGAIGLGLGFGLQKVVSNLVSGLILLVDRSVKPGDVIEVGDTYGWVNTLSARHVSILTRDGVEHLIPNEALITEKVVNWSYTNSNIRLKIPIGVSYDADLHEVIAIINEAAAGHSRVLKHPEPVTRLMEFGDSSVNFELRIWISDPTRGVVNVRSDILLAVWDKFKEKHIEIPYPQRVVHMKE